MRISILGSGTGYPNPLRNPPGLLIWAGGHPLLFDAGSGTLGRLSQAGVDLRDLTYLHFTHQHSDHCADLVPILQACRLMRRKKPLHIISSAAFLEYLRVMLEVNPWVRPVVYELLETDISRSAFKGPEWTVDSAATEHMPGSLAFRVSAEGKTVVYTGDATATADLATFARGADMLIAECSFPDERAVPGHLSPSEIGPIAEQAGVARLVLTHLYPVCNAPDIASAVSKHYSGILTIAHDGLTLDV